MPRNVNARLTHNGNRFRAHNARLRARAFHIELFPGFMQKQPFGHLTPGGIARTEYQDTFFHAVFSQGVSFAIEWELNRIGGSDVADVSGKDRSSERPPLSATILRHTSPFLAAPALTGPGQLPAFMAYCLRVSCSIRRAIFCRAA